MFAGSWNWRGESLTRPPRGYDPEHPFIEDIKRKDFVESVVLSEEQVCGPRFMREFVAACMSVSGIGRALSWTTSRFERTRDRSGTGTMACNVGANLRLLSLRSDWVC